MISIQGHLCKFELFGRKSARFVVSVLYFFVYGISSMFLFYTKIVYDLRVCHDYDPRSFGCNQV